MLRMLHVSMFILQSLLNCVFFPNSVLAATRPRLYLNGAFMDLAVALKRGLNRRIILGLHMQISKYRLRLVPPKMLHPL